MSRQNNILNHISSAASSVSFNPAGTSYPSDVKEVQTALSKINAFALQPYVNATESVTGIIRIGTAAEASAGSLGNVAIVPTTLVNVFNTRNASTSQFGTVRFGTGTELDAANGNNTRGLSTAGAWDLIRNRAQATEATRGTALIATSAAATSATNDTSIMTPLKVKLAIDTFAITTIAGADEINTGTVKIAAFPLTNDGLHAGFAVSPKGFLQTRATQTQVGTTRMATQAEANLRTATDLALSPATLPIATTNQYGITQLRTATQNATGFALTAHSGWEISNRIDTDVILKSSNQTTGYAITAGNLYITGGQDEGNGNAAVKKSYLDYRLGMLSVADASINQKGLVQLQNNAAYNVTNRALTPHGGWEIQNYVDTYFINKTSNQSTQHNLTANNFYATGAQDTNQNALVKYSHLWNNWFGKTIYMNKDRRLITNNQVVSLGRFTFGTSNSLRACVLNLPMLTSTATSYFQVFVTITTERGVYNDTKVLSYYGNYTGYGSNNDAMSVSPSLTFNVESASTWCDVQVRVSYLDGSSFAWEAGPVVLQMSR